MARTGSTRRPPSDETVHQMVDRIVGRFAPVRVVLFGSCAEDRADSNSDVDLLVVLDDVEDYHSATAAVLDALQDIPAPADVVIATPDDVRRRAGRVNDVVARAARHGVTLYERS